MRSKFSLEIKSKLRKKVTAFFENIKENKEYYDQNVNSKSRENSSIDIPIDNENLQENDNCINFEN
jgi:hypothetical protein